MSNGPTRVTRRSVAIGGSIAVALGLAAVGINAPRWFRAKTAYDDLLNKLIDRDAAVTVGRQAIDQMREGSDLAGPEDMPDELAKLLRARLADKSLADVAHADIVEGHVVEVRGWVMPITLIMLCVLAAHVT